MELQFKLSVRIIFLFKLKHSVKDKNSINNTLVNLFLKFKLFFLTEDIIEIVLV